MMFRKAKMSVSKIIDFNKSCSNCKTCSAGCKLKVGECLRKFAAKRITKIEPKILYAVVSGLHGDEPNENGDFFAWEDELMKMRRDGTYTFQTWNGKPQHLNHDENITVGSICDTFPIQSEKSVDMLVGTSRGYRIAGHDLQDLIKTGKIVDCSMGCYVSWSECSICGNIAKTEKDWCDHLKYQKARKVDGKLVYEINHDICGLENSWISEGVGADPLAEVRYFIANKKEK